MPTNRSSSGVVPKCRRQFRSHFDKVFKILSGIEKKARPRKRKTLIAQIASFFQKKEQPEEIERIVELFIAKGLVSESNYALTYNF